jgi:AcrR family transcriptional regulator
MGKPKKSLKSRRKRPEQASLDTSDHPRVARRERRRERSREEIIDAARSVLLKKGLGAATLEAVAKEVGLTKAALYYYFPSKDALFFELIFDAIERQSQAVHDSVENAKDGGDALRAIVRETVHTFAPRLDDFRLAFLHGQIAGPGAVRISPEQLARIRPLNDLAFAGAANLLSEEWKQEPNHAHVEPRMMAYLANIAAYGLLTLKGMVESVGDPLHYTDEELIEGFARVFECAAAPRKGERETSD